MFKLEICHLYPDLLNLYGDRGNIIALYRRALWRDFDIRIHDVSIHDPFDSQKYDIIFLGGGQDYEQELIQNDLLKNKASELKNAIEGNKVFLCICGGYQLLGKYYKTWDNKEIELLGAIDIWTIASKKRLVGNTVYSCDFLSGTTKADKYIIGFENHSGRTYLGDKAKPLGKVLLGNGNNGVDSFEGAHYKNVFCSYSHGSLLPKNPAFADHLLSIALKDKYKDFSMLEPLDDTVEIQARESLIKRFAL